MSKLSDPLEELLEPFFALTGGCDDSPSKKSVNKKPPTKKSKATRKKPPRHSQTKSKKGQHGRRGPKTIGRCKKAKTKGV